MSNCTPCTPANDELPIFCDPHPATDTAKRLLVEDEAFCQKALTTVPQQVLKTDGAGNLTWTNGASGTVLRKDTTGLVEFATLNSVLQSGPVDLGSQPLTTTGALTVGSGITANLTGNLTGSLTSGGSLILATAQNASGTVVDFASIPSWAKRITVIMNGISTNGSSPVEIRATYGAIPSTYFGSGISITPTSITGNLSTTGFQIAGQNAANIRSGLCILSKLSGNLWIASINGTYTDLVGSFNGGGSTLLTGPLDSIRITTVNGTDTFDAGTINISYEG